jgi:hypothetical protein
MPRASAAKLQSHPRPQRLPSSDSNADDAKASAQKPETSVHPVEPPREQQAARATGTSQSQQRRVLGVNVGSGHAEPHPETAAGQHATGSFTGLGKKSARGND